MACKSTVLMVLAVAGFFAIAFAAPSENKKLEGKNEKLETAESFYYNGIGYPYTGIHGYNGGSYYYPSPYAHNAGYLNVGYPYAYNGYDGGSAYYNHQPSYVASPYYYGK